MLMMRRLALVLIVALSKTCHGQEWVSISNTLAYQQRSEKKSAAAPRLRVLMDYSDSLATGDQSYNSYAQAWRLLGLYVDCSVQEDEEERRRLDDANDDAGDDAVEEEEDAGDDAVEEGEAEQEQQQEANKSYASCKRYMLWAAYVDLNYQGGGIGEYQIYQPETKTWDRSACEKSGSDRCARMDCHLQNTHYSLLGFFKEEYPVTFLKSLFQHQGSCTWNNDEYYSTMLSGLYQLPQGCSASGVVHDNQQLYVDLKPAAGGGVTVGVYMDQYCSTEYRGSLSHTNIWNEYATNNKNNNANGNDNGDENGNENNGNDDSVVDGAVLDYESLTKWNKGLNSFHVCQPCRTYDLSYDSGNNINNNNDENENNDNNDSENGDFVCQDQAGYAGVNQCAVFAKQTNLYKASLRDVAMASQQGGLVRTFTAQDAQQGWWPRFGFLVFAIFIFLIGLVCFCGLAKKRRKRIFEGVNSKPLI